MKLTFIKKTTLVALICAAIVLVSWTRSTTSVAKDLSDEEVFNGLVFMKGKLVANVPELQEVAILQAKLNPSALEQERLNKLQGDIVERIKAKHPGYLAHFKEVMTSGNQFAISAELRKSNEFISDALGDVLGIDFKQVASKRDEIAKMLGSKMGQLKDLYREYKAGEIDEAGFKAANAKIMTDEHGGLAKLFPTAANIEMGNVASTNSGYCAAINLAYNVNLGVNVNVGVNVNLGVNVNVGVNIYIFKNVHFWWSDSEQTSDGSETKRFAQDRLINSVAHLLKG